MSGGCIHLTVIHICKGQYSLTLMRTSLAHGEGRDFEVADWVWYLSKAIQPPIHVNSAHTRVRRAAVGATLPALGGLWGHGSQSGSQVAPNPEADFACLARDPESVLPTTQASHHLARA